MSELTFEQQLPIWITQYVVLLFSLSVHESAHAWTAHKMGDDTALGLGRVSLDPRVHIDPIGTILMPLLQLVSASGVFLAWAKPTPVVGRNFRQPRKAHILVAGAGPLSNLALAIVFTLLFAVAHRAGVDFEANPALWYVLQGGISLNVLLAVFNLLPLPPLDGSYIASWGLPRSLANAYDEYVRPYGSTLLLLLVVTGGLNRVVAPVLHAVHGLLSLLVT